LQTIASVAFGSADRKPVHLGNLGLGNDRIATFRSPIAEPVQWRFLARHNCNLASPEVPEDL